MKRKHLEKLALMDNAEISICRVIDHNPTGITFEVDEGLERPSEHLECYNCKETIDKILDTEQIESNRNNTVACSFSKDMISDIGGSDALFKCIVECYGQHRPLVLSPDMIWLVINQTLVKHINENAERFRDKIVSHDGIMDIIVESETDLLQDNPDWLSILDDFYNQIDKKTKGDIATTLVADFSTTTENERIASISTLMEGVQSYFRYEVHHLICGIPSITLQGTEEDWKKVLSKASILKKFGLTTWYNWLKLILSEFVRTASGFPNRQFWKSIVCQYAPSYISTHSGCIPEYTYVDGWCVALFPHKESDDENGVSGRFCYDKALAIERMESEMIRVGFKYKRLYPNGYAESYPMELWSGIVGVIENPKTFALTPKIGWFVRMSDEENESLDRLIGANEHRGIELTINTVPDILNKLNDFTDLTLNFFGIVEIPDWLFSKKIERLNITGKIDDDYKSFLKTKFPKVYINEHWWNIEEDDLDD